MSNQAIVLLISDSGYPIAPWLMTPYQNPNHQNKQPSISYQFPILKRRIRLTPEEVLSVILCCILHNIAKFLQDEDFPEPGDQEDEELIHDDGVNKPNVRQRRQQRRNEIAHIIHGMRRV
ncbi:Uncharacterized protein GBIM_20898 [Gryllus bimaculatus]|nr:Uncharacterized protein GBIM_20898 [Gryllus bimaculatus]